jgi:hypothetical protein
MVCQGAGKPSAGDKVIGEVVKVGELEPALGSLWFLQFLRALGVLRGEQDIKLMRMGLRPNDVQMVATEGQGLKSTASRCHPHRSNGLMASLIAFCTRVACR